MADFSYPQADGTPGYSQQDEANSTPDPLADFVTDCFNTYESQRKQLESKWDEWYRQWRCQEDAEDATKASEKSQIKVPACKEAVNNATDAIFQIVCADDWYDLAPNPPQLAGLDPMSAQAIMERKGQRAATLKDYLRYLFDRENIEDTIHSIIQDMCIYGVGIARVKAVERINRQVQRSNRAEPIVGQDGQILDVMDIEEVESVEQKINHPELEYIPIENLYISTTAQGIQAKQNAQGVIVRSYKKRFEVDQLYQDNVLGSEAPENDEITQDRLTRQGLTYQTTSDDVELFEYWGFVPNEVLTQANRDDLKPDPESPSGGVEAVIIVGNRGVTLKAAPNPFPTKERPFMCCKFDKAKNEFYGVGIMEVAWGPQKALDATVRARIDNKNIALNNIFGINVDRFVPGQSLKLHAGKALLFRGDPRESFMPLQVPDVTQNSGVDAAQFERYIQGSHGISPLIGGMPAKSSQQTATEVSTLMGNAATRIKTIVKRFEKCIIEPMLRWYGRIILQYLNDRELFLLTDSQTGSLILREITPDDVAEDFEFIARGSTRIAAQNELQKRMQLLQMVANPLLAQFANIPYMLKEVYKASGLRDAQAALIVQPPPQVQQMVQAQAPNSGQPSLAAPPSSQPSQQLAPAAAPAMSANPGAGPTGPVM